jgi:hypothetical protein
MRGCEVSACKAHQWKPEVCASIEAQPQPPQSDNPFNLLEQISSRELPLDFKKPFEAKGH